MTDDFALDPATAPAGPVTTRRVARSGGPAAALAALGVVFGDIGTSPLYTLKATIVHAEGPPSPEAILGVFSLIAWTLVIVTSLKYVSVAMRIDNDGEGGILALMALLGRNRYRASIATAGLLGAALIYGDGAITPAISVLSALEGLESVTPHLKPFVVPSAVLVLAALFVLQPLGTARIGRAFGPVMMLWFLSIAALGIAGILVHPSVLVALNPVYGVRFLVDGGLGAFLLLGGVFLCVTGAEALYADMGHFGAHPIRIAWHGVVLPSLLLNYAGQAAVLLEHGATTENIFYQLCPQPLLVPLILLATAATIIASQSIITGTYSMTRQAIQLGLLPRMRIKQTSQEGYGQIYVGLVNWMLMAATIGLTVGFGKSDNLASAYGVAVSGTMLLSTVLLAIAMRTIWHWSLLATGLVAGSFFIMDAAFFLANIVKFWEGGYVPVLLAAVVFTLMLIWRSGLAAVTRRIHDNPIPIATFMAKLAAERIARVPGTAVFLTRSLNDTPPVVAWYVEHAQALQQLVLAINVHTEAIPWVAEANRFSLSEIAPGFWRAQVGYGFMERPDVARLLEAFKTKGCPIVAGRVTYYVGLESIVPRQDGRGLPRWVVAVFAWMQRNATHVTDVFNFPRSRVVEIGRQIAI
jgi:KUP system potassium uptake protein